MRLMVLSTLVLAGLTTGVLCYPPLRHRVVAVVLAPSQASPGELASNAATRTLKDKAAASLRSVQAAAASLLGSPDTQPAPADAPAASDEAAQPASDAAADQAVQRKS
jgi:hypothetical protein